MGVGFSETNVLLLAVVVRVALLALGRWQDSTLDVPYTDIDYQVYSDAAKFVQLGQSPYERSTYRYTPLLAWLLLPNCIFAEYGKMLFSVCDIMAAMIMLLLLSLRGETKPGIRCLCISIWLFSPFTATISTRGNGEAVVVCMLMGLLYMLETDQIFWAAILYGIAVHWRIYPIVFAPSILIYLASKKSGTSGTKIKFHERFFSWKGIFFGFVSGSVFLTLGGIMHALYGMEFLEETYLYHSSRVDPRHNFSPYFYPAYLRAGKIGTEDVSWSQLGDAGFIFGILGMAMQIVIAYHTAAKDLATTFMVQSMAFVAFNKVSTAQYFVWYLCWVSVTLPKMLSCGTPREKHNLLSATIAWPIALAHWLGWAYLLEFQGYPVHLYIWVAGIVFFFTNMWCIVSVLKSTKRVQSV